MLRTISSSALMIAAVAACGGGGGSSSGGTTGSTNSAPVVNAGTDASADESTSVQLAATVSDADGDALTYTWSQTSGTAGSFSSTSVEDPTFTTPSVSVDEDVTLQLSVSDGTTSSSDTVTISVTDTGGGATGTAPEWMINTTERSTEIDASSGSSQGTLLDVQSAGFITISGVDYVEVTTDGIPKFEVVVDQDLLDQLAARPNATTDFTSGVTSATLTSTIVFGQDIGYNSTTTNCSDTGGDGYWPPGPVCPLAQGRTEYFPTNPTPRADTCDMGLGTLGLYVNGFAVFGWGDGMGDGDFQNLAAFAEQYDLDICSGHAANGEYHNHNYSQCLADLVGDDGTAHSPIIGFASDGYPIHGPWEDNNVLAVSGWVTRDYSSGSATGCSDSDRSCMLVDEYDISQGTTAASGGVLLDVATTTPSGNPITAFNGYYYEDYYFDGANAATSDIQLDQHNGHDTGDGLGYHYHVSMVVDGASATGFTPSFPFTIGPRFYGELEANAASSCGGAGGGGMGPPP